MIGLDEPYLVFTVQPSTSGSRSRCTPSRETSAPMVSCRRAILSISSMNTIPFCSALSSARPLSSSSLISFAASSSTMIFSASRTFTRRVRVRAPPSPERTDCSCCCISSMPGGAMISTPAGSARTSISTSLSSIRRARASRAFCCACRHRAAAPARRSRNRACAAWAAVHPAPLHGRIARAFAHTRELLLARHLHGHVGQFLDDGVDLAPT